MTHPFIEHVNLTVSDPDRTAGILSADDIDVFAGGQNALKAGGFDWITLSRGLGHEQVADDGARVGVYSDEAPQRAFWRQWQAMMDAPAPGGRAAA